MPKKPKKHRFHGTLSWQRKQELQEGASESAQPVTEGNDPESDPGDSLSSQSEEECLKETASERKRGTVTRTRTTEYFEDQSSISYRLVE